MSESRRSLSIQLRRFSQQQRRGQGGGCLVPPAGCAAVPMIHGLSIPSHAGYCWQPQKSPCLPRFLFMTIAMPHLGQLGTGSAGGAGLGLAGSPGGGGFGTAFGSGAGGGCSDRSGVVAAAALVESAMDALATSLPLGGWP